MADWLGHILNRLTGNAPAPAGQGLEVTYVHTWPWPPWITVLFLIGAVIYVTAIYLREPGQVRRGVRLALAGLRLAVIAVLMVMLYGWMQDRHRTDLPDIIVVVDDSDSMSVADQYDRGQIDRRMLRSLESIGAVEPSRVNLAKSLLLEKGAEWLNRLQLRYNLKCYLLSTSARIQRGRVAELEKLMSELEATQPASRLGNGLQQILNAQRGRPTAAVIVLTDGVTTEGKPISEAAQYARRKGIPFFLVGIGNENPPRDLRLADLLVDDAVFLGDLVHFDFKLSGSGFVTEKVRVRLKRKGQDGVLAERTMMLVGDGKPQNTRLSYRPMEQGPWEFQVEVKPLDSETNLTNNRISRLVQVRDETIRVLYVQEYPSLEFRYLKTLLERGLKRGGTGKAIELATVLQEADLDYVEQDETAVRVFPVSRDELFAYDVVIFGDVNPSYMSRAVLDNLATFVKERGGGIVFIAGPRHTPLAYRDTPLEELFPIDLGTLTLPDEDALIEQSYHVQPTRLGLSSPQMQLADTVAASLDIWRRLPPIRWSVRAVQTKSGVRVLADHPGGTAAATPRVPVICLQFIGAGKVVFHAMDESYLWSRFEGDDQYYERYWIQTIRYLSRSKLLGSSRAVELSPDRTQYFRGEPIPLRVRFFDERMAPAADDGVIVVVEREGGRRQRLTLHRDASRRGIFEGTASNLVEGPYRAWIASPTLDGQPPSRNFRVLPPPGERARLAMDATDLRQAAEISQGRFYTASNALQLLGDLPRGRQVRIESLPPTPVWNSPWLAGLLVALLTAEWLWRRRLGWL